MYLYIRGDLHGPVNNGVIVRFEVLLAARGAPFGHSTLYLCGRAETKLFGRAALLTVLDGVKRSEGVSGGAGTRPVARLRAIGGL